MLFRSIDSSTLRSISDIGGMAILSTSKLKSSQTTTSPTNTMIQTPSTTTRLRRPSTSKLLSDPTFKIKMTTKRGCRFRGDSYTIHVRVGGEYACGNTLLSHRRKSPGYLKGWKKKQEFLDSTITFVFLSFKFAALNISM